MEKIIKVQESIIVKKTVIVEVKPLEFFVPYRIKDLCKAIKVLEEAKVQDVTYHYFDRENNYYGWRMPVSGFKHVVSVFGNEFSNTSIYFVFLKDSSGKSFVQYRDTADNMDYYRSNAPTHYLKCMQPKPVKLPRLSAEEREKLRKLTLADKAGL